MTKQSIAIVTILVCALYIKVIHFSENETFIKASHRLTKTVTDQENKIYEITEGRYHIINDTTYKKGQQKQGDLVQRSYIERNISSCKQYFTALPTNENKTLEPASIQRFDSIERVQFYSRKELQVNRTSCLQRNISQDVLPLTALVSIPGAGSTWTRHLIESITGKYLSINMRIIGSKEV